MTTEVEAFQHELRQRTAMLREVKAELDALQSQNAELVALLDQIHEAANKVYQMGDATCRNVLVNIYEISGKVAALAKVQP